MGLDMYLYKTTKVDGVDMINAEPDSLKKSDPALYEKLMPYMLRRGQHYTYDTYHDEIGYWRKANHIHSWFVENVQNNVDDCGSYEVTKEQIQELLNICNEVLHNKDRAESLLPTREGFFFGSTNYDNYYYEDIDLTVDICQRVLSKTDFDKEIVFYCSSW